MSIEQNIYSDKLSHKCLIRIQSVYTTLKSAEKKAADFILKNPENVADGTIIEVAELAGCSEATFVRIARKLGYTGYPMLKASILQKDEEDTGVLYEEITPNDDPISVVNKVFQTSIQSLLDTVGLLNTDSYLDALHHMKNAKHILFAGVGDSFAVAYTGYLKFSRIGLSSNCSQDFDIQLMEVSKLRSDDLLVIISHSGRTQSLYEVAKYAKLREVPILTITNYPISPIAKIADTVLLTATFVPNIFGEIMTKRIPELCLLETLYVNTVMHFGKEVSNTLADSTMSISINKL